MKRSSNQSIVESDFGPSRCNLLDIASEKGLYARYLGKWGANLLSRPLGCLYEEIKSYWIIADYGNNKVRGLDGENFQESFSLNDLLRPGGVTIVERGRTFGVIDNHYISLFDFRALEITLVSEKYYDTHRDIVFGLSVTSCGNYLMTLSKSYQKSPAVLLYDIRKTGKPAEIFEYDMDSLAKGSLPCFMDCMKDLFVISDLGIRAVYILTYKLKKGDEEPRINPYSWLSLGSKSFEYPAGVCFDSNGGIVLSDAGASKLYWFSSDSTFKGEVIASDGFCYGSGICLSSDGHLMVCGRKSNEVKFYQLEPV